VQNDTNAQTVAIDIAEHINNDVADAQDNLLLAKITWGHHTSASWRPDPNFAVGDFVMLSTANQCHEYNKKGEYCMVKFFPCWDGLYKIVDKHFEASTYKLDLPNNAHLVFHVSELKKFSPNDNDLFPS
jgi:hypothetical protein